MKKKFNSPLRILVSGLNWSGSGTVVGLLREYDGVVQIPGGSEETAPAGYLKLGEFEDFRGANLIGDQLLMQENLVPADSIVQRAKRRNNLQIPFSFFQSLKKTRNFKQLKESVALHKQLYKTNKSYCRLGEDFNSHNDLDYRLNRAKNWIAEISDICGEENGSAVVFDQPIHLGLHNSTWPKVFQPYKLIVVYRDPRDVIAEQANRFYLFRGQIDSNIRFLYGEDLEGALNYRIDTTLARMNAVDKMLSVLDKNNVMLISFEQMVNNYDLAVKKIEIFTGLGSNQHNKPKIYFDPGWSVRNIGLHKNAKVQIPEIKLQPLLQWYNNKLKEYPLN
jgi:hypothetical protein